MKVIVDTPIWASALRKSGVSQPPVRNALSTLIQSRGIVLLGPVRQEILSGIKERNHFERLRDELSAFPDYPILQTDYEDAAICFNKCRARGVQGSNTDFLICAVGLRNAFEIFTDNQDFEQFSNVLGIALFEPRKR